MQELPLDSNVAALARPLGRHQLGLPAEDSPYIFLGAIDDKGHRTAKQAVPVTAKRCVGQGLKVLLISVPSFGGLVIVRRQQLRCGGRAKEEEVGG